MDLLFFLIVLNVCLLNVLIYIHILSKLDVHCFMYLLIINLVHKVIDNIMWFKCQNTNLLQVNMSIRKKYNLIFCEK